VVRALFRRPARHLLWPIGLLLLLTAAVIAAYELIASPLQAMFLARYGERLHFQVEDGPSNRILYPEAGPSDIRLGYVGLPNILQRLQSAGFSVTRQVRQSPEMLRLAGWGLYLPYQEKSAAGLDVRDCQDQSLYTARYPAYTYADFAAVPPVVANTLLFIENRELLDPNHPQRNPAVEWDRLAQAVLEKAMQMVDPNRNVPGGSTLATQIEKYRHSPDGLTLTAGDKLTQMASASVRAYLDGPDTRATRRRIVLDYLNTVPLSAAPGYGEVLGLGDGLTAWFGLDFDRVNRLLAKPANTPEAARAYRHVLGLLIAQRKPSWYLLTGRKNLDQLVDTHLRLLASSGVISPAFRNLALKERIHFRNGEGSEKGKKKKQGRDFIEKKAANAIRTELAALLGVPRLYDLDRLDLRATATLHVPTQRAVTDLLGRLSDPVVAEAAGLFGERLLSPRDDLDKPIYSFTLYQLSEQGALLRVQADNLNQPFDINQGAKLDMGSSAKLRTLITYLTLIAELHGQYAGLTAEQLAAAPKPERDELTRWAIDYLRQAQDRSLRAMLEAAMARTYSANPGESFFTGGGVHRFANFNNDDNGRHVDLWEATRNSINLPFIRLMRDIVRHFMFRAPGTAGRVLHDAEDPRRQSYLLKFADNEGRAFLARFYKKYKGLDTEAVTATLLNHLTANPKRLAAVFRYLHPQADEATFVAFLKSRLANPDAFDEGDFRYLYETYGADKFNLSDRGYITQIHPLELWLVAYLRGHPKAVWSEIVQASTRERVEVYDWLFKTSRKNAQDIRIQSLIEIEAFQEIHRRWRKLGYPFSSLVPSYATAIGSSADRPAALAELMGVILNDGVKLPSVSLTRLEFANGTPYQGVLARNAPTPERIFPVEAAQVIRTALVRVVEEGTARRLKGTFPLPDGGHLTIGGKTGTGDHRFETYAASGAVLESKVVNRTATFAFFLGKSFYGVMTVFVPGEAAADYRFTSGLATQIVKALEPALRPLVLAHELPEPGWTDLARQFDAANPPLPPAKKIAPDAPAPAATEQVPPPDSAANAAKAKAPAVPAKKDGKPSEKPPAQKAAAPTASPAKTPPTEEGLAEGGREGAVAPVTPAPKEPGDAPESRPVEPPNPPPVKEKNSWNPFLNP